MKVQANKAGTFPAGVHWSAGKVREIAVEDGVELPEWLVEVKATKGKAKKAAKPSKA